MTSTYKVIPPFKYLCRVANCEYFGYKYFRFHEKSDDDDINTLILCKHHFQEIENYFNQNQ